MRNVILAFAFILLLATAYAAIIRSDTTGAISEYDTDAKTIAFNLKKGWNLVGMGTGGRLDESTACREGVIAFFIWSPTLAKYVGGAIKNATLLNEDAIEADVRRVNEDRATYAYTKNGAAWLYAKNEGCKFIIGLEENQITGNNLPKKLARGWNFLTILPWMVGKTGTELFKDCRITKVNSWMAYAQGWGQTSSTEAARNLFSSSWPLPETYIGNNLVVYTENECDMAQETPIVPPPLPS